MNHMRYFIYISDSKVEMLFPQVPGAVKKTVATELGFDLKIFSGSVGSEHATLDSRVARLQAVEQHILSKEQPGDGSSNSSWIHGTFEVCVVDMSDDAALFVSSNPSLTLAFGGSSKHLIGAVPRAGAPPYSYLQALVNCLETYVEQWPEFALESSESRLRHHLGSGISQGFDAWVTVIRHIALRMEGPKQTVEVLAKRLVSEDLGSESGVVCLATPLYIAMVD